MPLFPDALQRRAAEHIRVHTHDPASELPDDEELAALVTSLLTAPMGAGNDLVIPLSRRPVPLRRRVGYTFGRPVRSTRLRELDQG